MSDPAVIRRHAILDAAVVDMLAHGAHALKVDRVARAAGVAKGTVYLYFPSRDGLISAAITRGLIMDELSALADDPTPITPTTWPTVCAALWTALEERNEVLQILVRDGLGLLSADHRTRLGAMVTAYAARWRGPRPDEETRAALAALVSQYAAGRPLTARAVAVWGPAATPL